MKTKFLVLLTCCFIMSMIFGCLTIPVAYYDVGLMEVERPADVKTRYGEYTVKKVEEEGEQKFYYSDEMVDIAWYSSGKGIGFELKNKTEHSIKIIWDEAAFVDHEGQSERILHSGVKYADSGNPQPPSVVVRGGSISQVVYPADKIHYAGSTLGWQHDPLFPTKSATKKGIQKDANEYIGVRVQILLPLKIEDVVNEYLFTFEVEGATVQ